MKITFNPSTVAALTTPPNNKDITFDLRGRNIFARGVKFYGTDTNTWRDIKINNVSIGSNTLDLRNGSNTTLTNTNGIVTINSTWRPVVDNLTSDSTTSSLSAKQGKVLKALIDGKSNSDHNHDGIYVRAFRTSNDNIDSDWGQSFKTFDPIPLGTPPEKNPNISLLSIGENFNRRKQLAFIWDNDNIYYRRRIDSGFTNWRRLAFVDQIPTSLKNPYALTISLNGTSQGPYDGSAAKNINITPSSIGAAVSNHSHDYLVVNSADDKSFNSAYHNFQVLYADGGNGITGKPANVNAFGLFKFRAASGWSGQMLLANGGSLYIRSSEDAKMTNTLAWKTILDSSNYSGILDSRYYTESEVNSLLDAKLNRQNLSYGTWNPRGYHLAADYHYNGGDLSISESGGKIHVSVDGYFWQNEGQYRVLDTSDIGDIRNSVTLHQFLSATDVAWYPLVWGGNAHYNTSDSTGAVYKSYDKLSWQTSSQTLYATNIQTNNIKNLSIGGGIYWNPNVESASDGSDAASITLVRQGVAGGTTLVLSQMNDTNDTIQFKTNTAARLYHNSYPILTTQNTYVNNNKGYINGTEITQVNNSDTLDGYHAASFVKMKQFRFDQYKDGFWTKILTITINSTSDLQPVIAFNWIPSECARKVWAEFTISWRSNSPIFYAIWKGTAVRTLTCVNSSGNIWNVWVQGDKNEYDPFGEVQVTYAHNISSYNGGSLGYSDSDPGGTRCTLGGYVNYARSTGNADTLDGYPANGSNDRPYGHIPTIESDGVMEVGRYIDFHNDNNGKHDFSTRLQSTGNYGNEVNLPSASGTLALINDVNNYYWANVKISTSSSTTTSPTFSNVYLGSSLYLNNRGSNSIYNGPNDSANGVGGPLNNLVFSSWYGVSFTTSCAGLTYTNKNAVSINCRTGQLYARQVQANGFMHTGHNNNDAVLLAGGDYKTLNSIWGGDSTHFVFLGYLTLHNGVDGTISDSFMCLGKSVPFTYTRGGAYCRINIPDTSFQTFYIKAAIASVHYSGAGMGNLVGDHRGDGAWWLHCYAVGSNAVQVKGFHSANHNNDSWWGGNPLYSSDGAAKIITVCLFGYVKFR